MKEKLLPAALTGAVILGANALEGEATEPCIDEEARAMALSAYRTAVDSDIASTLIYLALTGQEGQPYTYEEYRELFDYMTDDILEGKDPMSPGFRQDAGTIYEDVEGGE